MSSQKQKRKRIKPISYGRQRTAEGWLTYWVKK